MSFLSGIKNKLQKVRSVLGRVPKTVDEEYDACVDRVKGFDDCVRRLSQRCNPLLSCIQNFVSATDELLQTLEKLSNFEQDTKNVMKGARGSLTDPPQGSSRSSSTSENRIKNGEDEEERQKREALLMMASSFRLPWTKDILYETRLSYVKLSSRLLMPKQSFEKNAGMAIKEAEKQLKDCRKLAKKRNQARDEFDRCRAKVRKIKQLNEQKRVKGNLSPEDILRQREIEITLANKCRDFETLNQLSKRKWQLMLAGKNELAFKVFESLNRFHRDVASALIGTLRRIDQKHAPLVKAFYKRQYEVDTQHVQSLTTASVRIATPTIEDFSVLHPTALFPCGKTKSTVKERGQQLVAEGSAISKEAPNSSHFSSNSMTTSTIITEDKKSTTSSMPLGDSCPPPPPSTSSSSSNSLSTTRRRSSPIHSAPPPSILPPPASPEDRKGDRRQQQQQRWSLPLSHSLPLPSSPAPAAVAETPSQQDSMLRELPPGSSSDSARSLSLRSSNDLSDSKTKHSLVSSDNSSSLSLTHRSPRRKPPPFLKSKSSIMHREAQSSSILRHGQSQNPSS